MSNKKNNNNSVFISCAYDEVTCRQQNQKHRAYRVRNTNNENGQCNWAKRATRRVRKEEKKKRNTSSVILIGNGLNYGIKSRHGLWNFQVNMNEGMINKIHYSTHICIAHTNTQFKDNHLIMYSWQPESTHRHSPKSKCDIKKRMNTINAIQK